MKLRETIMNRRAYRSIDPFQTDESMLKEITEFVGLSASCFNNQPWRFVFVYEPGILQLLKESLAKGNAWAKRSSLIVAVVSKPDLDCQIRGKNYYLFDSGMASAFLILLLTEKGLVAHPIVGFNEKKAKSVLKVPDDMTIVSLIIVGKHAKSIYPELSEQQREFEINRPKRIPIEEFVFFNRYGR